MTRSILYSAETGQVDWSEAKAASAIYGVKAASCLALPRAWIPSFALIPVDLLSSLPADKGFADLLDSRNMERLRQLAGKTDEIIIRSSIVGESIWDRGTYISITVNTRSPNFIEEFNEAIQNVIVSAAGKSTGLMIQEFVAYTARGDFGNLQRISKTRDQWEISTVGQIGLTSRLRLNSQRDVAANPEAPILARSGISTERLFGSIAAWINNELLRGKSQRVNCEWITDNRKFYIVQIDEEDEDILGLNPFQLRIPTCSRPKSGNGAYLRLAEAGSLDLWDKLKVLKQLWEEGASHKPTLFFLPLSELPKSDDLQGLKLLERDFLSLIGPSGIIVRTSVRADGEKIFNLPRTECLTPEKAVRWCVDTAATLSTNYGLDAIAFVVHRFVASKASAWVRADSQNPMVEIHSLWGLPDALQYCPYDIWEVHIPTSVATDYPEYKSDMLIPRDDGSWVHSRIKNELARANSITTGEAKDIATRSLAISERMGKPCHIMWFVGCLDEDGTTFNIPWYWTEAHPSERNNDRTSYNIVVVSDRETLQDFSDFQGPRNRHALALKPIDLDLMRDTSFISSVGQAAKAAGVPVILFGSTLAHAYYQLRKTECVVVTPSEKERVRIRRTATLGKLVRDKIPSRIAERQELEVTRKIPLILMKGYLVSKLLEEVLELREAARPDQKKEELADIYEVFRALAKSENISVSKIVAAAKRKREKAGGFEDGLILLQTGIAAAERSSSTDLDRAIGQILAEQTAEDTIELPFSFFGFMEFDQPRSIIFEHFGIRVDISLRSDRIELRIVRASEQLGLPLDEPNSAGQH